MDETSEGPKALEPLKALPKAPDSSAAVSENISETEEKLRERATKIAIDVTRTRRFYAKR